MIMLNTVNCRGFVSCSVALSPSEKFMHPNAGTGINNQFIYLLSGSIEAAPANGEKFIMQEKTLYDMEAYMGSPITFTDMGTGCYSFGINPVPENKFFSEELLVGPVTKTINGTVQEQFIICIEGNIVCNSVSLNSTQYANILNNKVVNVDIPEGAVAIVFTVRS